jgi:hypothetical protein
LGVFLAGLTDQSGEQEWLNVAQDDHHRTLV